MESEWGTFQRNRRRQTNKQRAQSNHASHRPSPRGDQAICASVRLYNGSPSKQEIANIALIRRGKTQNALMDVSSLALCSVCVLEFCLWCFSFFFYLAVSVGSNFIVLWNGVIKTHSEIKNNFCNLKVRYVGPPVELILKTNRGQYIARVTANCC